MKEWEFATASGQADLKRWLAWWDPAHAALSQGQLLWNARMHWQPDQWKGVVQADLRGVSGRWKFMSFEDYSVALNLDAEYHNQQLHMGNCHLEVRQRAHRGGSMGWHGMMDTQSGKGDISFFTVGLNHHALKPFLPKGSEFSPPSAWEDAKIHLDGRWTAEDFEKNPWTLTSSMAWKVCTLKGNRKARLKATLALESQWDAAQWQLLPSSLVVEGLSEPRHTSIFMQVANEVPIRRACKIRGSWRLCRFGCCHALVEIEESGRSFPRRFRKILWKQNLKLLSLVLDDHRRIFGPCGLRWRPHRSFLFAAEVKTKPFNVILYPFRWRGRSFP